MQLAQASVWKTSAYCRPKCPHQVRAGCRPRLLWLVVHCVTHSLQGPQLIKLDMPNCRWQNLPRVLPDIMTQSVCLETLRQGSLICIFICVAIAEVLANATAPSYPRFPNCRGARALELKPVDEVPSSLCVLHMVHILFGTAVGIF